MNLTNPQKKTIASWRRRGYKIVSSRSGSERHVLLKMEKRKHYEYPEFCPYTNWWSETYEVELNIDKVGFTKIVKEFRYIEYWHCDWPKPKPKEVYDKIYAGSNPMLPIREIRQLEIPVEEW